MPRRHLRKIRSTDLLPGLSLAARTAEMYWAAAQVIQTRMSRLATAGFPLDPKDQREIVRMGAEKIAAMNEAALEAAVHMAENAGKVATAASNEALAQKVLKPFRTRVKANVRRLTKKG
jgi:hypothetical protein